MFYCISIDNEFPLIINAFEYSPGEHSVMVVVEDSAGKVKTYSYTFTGMTPEGKQQPLGLSSCSHILYTSPCRKYV